MSFRNSTTRTHRLCLRPDQTHGQNLYMSRLNRQVYDQTKSADLSETRADPIGLCRRPGRRPESPTKSGRARLVEFGHKLTFITVLLFFILCFWSWGLWSWSRVLCCWYLALWSFPALYVYYNRYYEIQNSQTAKCYHMELKKSKIMLQYVTITWQWLKWCRL